MRSVCGVGRQAAVHADTRAGDSIKPHFVATGIASDAHIDADTVVQVDRATLPQILLNKER
ncbi:MAG TPA: hypothetical protein VFJ96_05925 [Gemmatimonadaceae bacterium]|nr:hypothetical protein [Gemmatimonadaceae bacterium]